MRSLLAAAALAAATLVPVSAPASGAPVGGAVGAAIENITIDVVTFAGTGCSPGTAVAAISPDGEAVTLIYSNYLVQSGMQRNCTATMRINIPGGLSYSIVKADYYGFKRLSSGTSATLWTSYRFAGGNAVSGTRSLAGATGAQGANWHTEDTTGALAWSLCGEDRYFVASSRLTLGSAPANDYVNMDSTDVAFSTIFQLQWLPC